MVDIALSIARQIIQTDTDPRTNIGDLVEYTYTLQNTSANNLTDLILNNIKGTLTTPFSGSIAAGETVILKSRYTLQREDLDTGRVLNIASVSQADGTLASNTLNNQFVLTQAFGLSVVNTFIDYNDANGNQQQDVDETFTYQSVVSNTGTTSLFNLQLFDDNGTPGNTADDTPVDITTASPSSLVDLDNDGVADDLPAGGTFTVISTGKLNQVSIDNGETNNSALVTARQPNGNNRTATSPAGSTIPQIPAIELIKTAGAINDIDGNGDDPGDQITYSYTVTNTGNVTLNNVVLIDDNGTPSTADDVTVPLTIGGNTITTLAPGQVATGSYIGTLTQTAINAGQLRNIANVEGTSPIGEKVTATDDAIVNPSVRPAIDLIKTAGAIQDGDGDGVNEVGDQVTYTYTVKNTGNVPLTAVQLIDDNGTPGNTSDDKTISLVDAAGNPTTTLAPNQTATGTYVGALTQAAIDTANLTNIAVVTGTPPRGPNVTDTDTATVQPISNAAIALIKQAGTIQDTNGDGANSAGDEVVYTYTVTNTGNVTLRNLVLQDDNGTPEITTDDKAIELRDASNTITTTLAPGQTATGSFTGKLTQAAIDAGQLTNIANVEGTPPTGPKVTDTDTQTVIPNLTPAIDLIKTAGEIQDTNGDQVNSVGDEIIYTYTVKNTGNTTLSSIVLTDDNGTPGNTGDDQVITIRDAANNVTTTLAPGQTATGTFTGKLTQTAIDAGQLTNIANVVGTPPDGPNVTDTDTQTVRPNLGPAIDLIKKAGTIQDTNGDKVNSIGDEITYTYTVKNTGNVTLNNIVLQDDNGTPSDTSDDQTISIRDAANNLITSLAPSQTATGSFIGKLTQAAIESGKLTNIAIVEGTPPTGPKVTDTDTQTVNPAGTPAISLVKTADKLELKTVGEIVTYTYTATNTGNVNLFNVSLSDDNGTPSITTDDFAINFTTGLTDLDGDLQIDDLAIGASAIATYQKTITAADLTTTSFTNIGKVVAVDRTNKTVQATDPETITFVPPIPKKPGIALKKDGKLDLGHDCVLTPGDIITYTFTITNTGEVTLDKLELVDTLPGLSAFQFNGPTVLNPGQSITATATYAVTEGNICDGFVKNEATVYGNPIGNNPNSRTDDVTAIARKTIDLNAPSGGKGNDVLCGGGGNGNLGGGYGNDNLGGGYGNDGLSNNPGYSTVRNSIYGTNGADVITTSGNQNYTVYANEGRNTIVTNDGSDNLYGGSDVDVVVAGNGNNTIYANEGQNIIITGSGNDRVFGGSSSDWIFTGAGDDLIYANEGDNYVAAGTGDNQVYLGSGADYAVLTAGTGSTTIYNFNAAIDKFGLAGLNAADINVTKVSTGGYFTRVSVGNDILAELNGVHLDKSQLQFESLGNAGNTSVSFLQDPFRSTLRNQLLTAGIPTTTVNNLFA